MLTQKTLPNLLPVVQDDRLNGRKPGYSLVLLVPSDLPVLLKIALEICNTQISEHLIETVVICDRPSKRMNGLLNMWAQRYTASPIRLVQPRLRDRMRSFNRRRSMLLQFQLHQALDELQTTHAICHRPLCFLTRPDVLQWSYECSVQHHLAWMAIVPSFPLSTRNQPTLLHQLNGEILFNVDWVQRQQWANERSPRLAQSSNSWQFPVQGYHSPVLLHPNRRPTIYFDAVLQTYRHFCTAHKPFEDSQFQLLLMRLLIDAYDQSGFHYSVPLLEDLLRGTHDRTSPVSYLRPTTWQNYRSFRAQIQSLLEANCLDPMKAAILHDEIQLCDRTFQPALI